MTQPIQTTADSLREAIQEQPVPASQPTQTTATQEQPVPASQPTQTTATQEQPVPIPQPVPPAYGVSGEAVALVLIVALSLRK